MGNACCCNNQPDKNALEQQDDETFLNDTQMPGKLTNKDRLAMKENEQIEEEPSSAAKQQETAKTPKEAAKAEKEAKKEAAKAEKEAKKEAVKVEKEAAKAEKEAKKEAAKAEKVAKKEAAKQTKQTNNDGSDAGNDAEGAKAAHEQIQETAQETQKDAGYEEIQELFEQEEEAPAKESKPEPRKAQKQEAQKESKQEDKKEQRKVVKQEERSTQKNTKESQKQEKESQKQEKALAAAAAAAAKKPAKRDPKEIQKAKKAQEDGDKKIKLQSLKYHQHPVPGKFVMVPTKALKNQRDLAMAHTPGVAEPCLQISKDPEIAFKYTSKGRTVACISNGTSVLGLGNIGALAAKPDLEGKAVLYKQFSGIDCVDLCIEAPSVDQFIDTVRYLGPSFGAINLESLQAPDCFEIEAALKEEMNIPVFHNDQHGSAVMVLAGLQNALAIKNKKLSEVKIVINGAGAAGIGTMKLLVAAGANQDSCFICDTAGLIYAGRSKNMNEYKEAVATTLTDSAMSLEQISEGADVLIGFSDAEQFSAHLLKSLNTDPIVFALSNPYPEILPQKAKQYRPDCIIATSRPEHPNQINNMMAFPFIFRAVLDTFASDVNEDMLIAAADAIASLAREPVPESVRNAYEDRSFEYGPNYILPTPFDSRLLENVSCAVAQVAQKSGVAKQEIMDFNQYQAYLVQISSGAEDAQFVTKKKK